MFEKIKEFLADTNKRKVVFNVLVTFFATGLMLFGQEPHDLSTWSGVGLLISNIVLNPYVLGVCIWNAYCSISSGKKDVEVEFKAEGTE